MRRPHALPMSPSGAFGRRARRVAGAGLACLVLASAGCTRDVAYIGNAAEPTDGATPTDGPSPDGGPDADVAVACEGAASPARPPAAPWNCEARCFRVEGLAVGGADFASAPRDPAPESTPAWVYPLDGSVHPLDLPEVTLQWRRGPEARRQETFEIQIEGSDPAAPYLLYTPQVGVDDPTPNPDASIFVVPAGVWRTIALDNAGAAIQLKVRALSAVDGQVSNWSPLLAMRLSSRAIGGALSYWSSCVGPDGSDCTALRLEGLERHFLGSAVRSTLVRAESPAAAGSCVGCHSISADGGQLAFSVDYDDGRARVTAAAAPGEVLRTTSPPAGTPIGSPVLSPDGRRLLVSYGPGATAQSVVLEVYDTAGGAPVFRLDRSALGDAIGLFAPAWSPDGQAIAATRYRSEAGRSVTDGDLVLWDWNEGAATLHTPRTLVPQSDTEFHLYPAFSPDGKWVVFATAVKGGTTTPDGHPHTRLQMIGRAGGPVIALNRASAEPYSPGGGVPLGQPATRPQLVSHPGCAELFVIFSSQRDYGFLSIPDAGARWNQLWLSALDLGRTGPGQDPSSPPVWLPAQRRRVHNRRPIWSSQIRCSENGACGPGATCVGNVCAPQ